MNQPSLRQPQIEYSLSADSIVGMFDHAILQPMLTDAEMRSQIADLRAYPLASICIKPCAVALAVDALAGTDIAVGTVIGFPHGSQKTSIKVAETQQAFEDGCLDVDMVISVGKALGGDWAYLHHEISAVLDVVHAHSGVLKVIFETDYFPPPNDDPKIRLCHLCTELGVHFVKTSTGFGYMRQPDGTMATRGATDHDIRLMREHSGPAVGVKPSGGVRSLDDVLRLLALGATRFGTTSTVAIHKAAISRFGR